MPEKAPHVTQTTTVCTYLLKAPVLSGRSSAMAKLPNPKPWKFSGRLIVTLGSALFLFLLVPAVSFRRTSKLSQVLQAVAAHTVETSCLSTASPVPGAVQPVGLADSLWPRGQVHKVIYDQHLSLWAFHDLKGQILQGLLEHISDDTAAKHTVVICGLEYGEEAELYASEGFKTVVFEPLAAWADKFLERITDDVAKRVVLHKVGAAVQRRYVYLSQWLIDGRQINLESSTRWAADRTP